MTARAPTTLRADMLAAKLFEKWLSGATTDSRLIRAVAEQAFESAAEFMREAAIRDPLTGEKRNDGLPRDVEGDE